MTTPDTQAQEDRIGGSVICPVRLGELHRLKELLDKIRDACVLDFDVETIEDCDRAKASIDAMVREAGERKVERNIA